MFPPKTPTNRTASHMGLPARLGAS
jgi:hypothetical protein